MEDARFTVIGQVLKVYPRRQGKIIILRTGLIPAAREWGMVLGLGGHGANQLTLPVLSTELGSWLHKARQTQSPPPWSSQAGDKSKTVNETSHEEQ